MIKDFGRGDAARKEYTRQQWEDTSNALKTLLNTYGTRKFNKSCRRFDCYSIELVFYVIDLQL